MKAIRIVPGSLVALTILMPGTRAQAQQLAVSLVQTVKPIIRSYPGVSLGILGIQTGMTVAQVEAIAAKNNLGKPLETKINCSYTFNGITAQSQEFIAQIEYGSGTDHDFILYFNSPVTGNTLSSMYRAITFRTDGPQKQPLRSALKADLVKQYGTPSAPDAALSGGAGGSAYYYASTWLYGDKSDLKCPTNFCPSFGSPNTYQHKNYDLKEIDNQHMQAFAPAGLQNGVDFMISTSIFVGSYGGELSNSLTVAMGDFQAVESDVSAAKEQFQAAILKVSNKQK